MWDTSTMETMMWTAVISVIVTMCGTMVVMLKSSRTPRNELQELQASVDQIKGKLDDCDAEDEDGVPIRFSAVKLKKSILHTEKMMYKLIKELGLNE